MKLISIIVPCYNEEKMIESFLRKLFNALKNIKNYNFEVICINDGSTDGSLKLLKETLKLYKTMKVISFSKNFGHESAINCGINTCSGDAAIVMDADLQDPPSYILELIKKYEEGYDVVNVKRVDRSSDSFFKRTTAKIFYKVIAKWAYKIKVEENVNNFRLISKRVINVVKNLSEKNKVFRFEVPFVGFKTTYIELVRPERAGGKSHYSLTNMSRLAIDSIVSVSTQPLNLITKIFLILSGLFSLSVVSEIVLFIISNTTKLLNISNFSYLIWLAINIFTLLALIILFSIAIVAQYIARIHIETQDRPIYVIDEIIDGDK